MRKGKLDRDLIVLLVSTTVTIASWIGFEVYRAYMRVSIEPQVEKHLVQIDPSLNPDIFSKLGQLEP